MAKPCFSRGSSSSISGHRSVPVTARGTPLDTDEFIAHDHNDIVTNIGDCYPSMCQDAFNKRQTEIDVLNGKIAEYGKELGIPTPTCDVLSTIVRCIQDNYDRQF